MYWFLNRLAAVSGGMLFHEGSLVPCPVCPSTTIRCLFIAAVLLLSTRSSKADIGIAGDVTPVDDRFTTSNEGLPAAGNSPDQFSPVNAQPFWEGYFDSVANTNVNVDIVVGRRATGILQITQVELRDMNLVIGDSAAVGENTAQQNTGTVYITGAGSLFNNDPYRIPSGIIIPHPNFQSIVPRIGAGPDTTTHPGLILDGESNGFDLYVGRAGFGTLRIDAFGRAEIEDAVLVGDFANSVGNLTVDGFNSSLIAGGSKNFGPTTETNYHMTIIGRQGTGNLTISNAATMSTQVFTNGTDTVGAALGSTPYSVTLADAPDAGGRGTVTVTGNGSRWIVGGTLQVGGFDIGTSSGGVLTTGGDLEGDDTQYGSESGRGTLYVNDGGLVQVNYAANAVTGGGSDPNLFLAIGRFGVVQLAGGTIQIGAPLGGAQNQATSNKVQVINDGLIAGSGRINTGTFRNRYHGIVRVDPGQSLVIDSSSEFTTGGGATPVEPLVNYGMIQVIGNSQAQAQLEFVRSPTETQGSNQVRPFVNLPLGDATTPPPTPPAFVGGQISAQYANLRFGSGLENHSMLAFTAGTNNITGRVVSVGLDPINPSGDPDDTNGDTAQVLVSGTGTTAVFHDDLAFDAGADLNLVNGGKVVVLNQHSFVMAGNLSVELSYAHPSLITVGGDVGIGPAGGGNNDLNISLASDALQTLKHGDAFEIIAFTGDIAGVNTTIPNSPTIDYALAPLFTDIDVSPDVFALHNLVPQVQFAAQGVYVTFLDPSMVGPGSGAIAPDFNGDGVIDSADFAIWKAHVGTLSGASVLDGDADGDGDVDGLDFLKWQRNVGKPMPWNGAGAGSGSSTAATVPEPASLALLACGGFAAVALRRRRAAR